MLNDPILLEGGTNLYVYADDDPVNNIDPDGTFVAILAGDVPGLGVMNAAQFGNFMAGCDAGYQMDPVALQIVKAYGSWYAKHDVGLWEVAFFGGDNWDSVNHINQGWGYCFEQRWGSGPLACVD